MAKFIIPASRFNAMNWPTEQLGAEAIVYPGTSIRDHARAAVQMLSRKPIPRRTIFTHTGWRKIDNRWTYLHGGGAIDEGGRVEGVQVELPAALELFELPEPPQGEGLKAAIRSTLERLSLAADPISVPCFVAPFRAALAPCDFGIHLAGPSGVFKSEMAALVQQHFGPGLDARHFPGSWQSTDNALEGLLFSAKDAVTVVDDFAPCGGPHDVARWHQRADRIIRAQGNNAGRGRMRADGTLRPPKPPRGLVLSTGEDIPRGQSLRARMLIMEISKGDIDSGVLTRCQSAGKAGEYAAALAGFVQYLAKDYERLRQNLRSEVEALRHDARECNAHGRTPEIVANLALGLRYFLAFAQQAGAISASEGRELWQRGWTALRQAALRQADHQTANEPASRFIELLTSAISSGHAHLADPDGSAPANPAAWGWRQVQSGTGAYVRDDWRPMGDRVGWIDHHDVYLDPEASFRSAQGMAGSSGDGLSITARTLRKRLDERGMVVRAREHELLSRKVLEGRPRNVLHLAQGVLSAQSTISTISTNSSHEGAENGMEWGNPMAENAADMSGIPRWDPPSNRSPAPSSGPSSANGGNGGKREEGGSRRVVRPHPPEEQVPVNVAIGWRVKERPWISVRNSLRTSHNRLKGRISRLLLVTPRRRS